MNQRIIPFQPNSYYHVYNRGHNKQAIFLNHKDYARYLKRLKEYLGKHNVTLLAYCLMPNHVHLLLYQKGEEPIDRFMHRLHTAFTMYFNKKYERVGAVFQGRFKAKLIETDEYLLHVSRYIHINPIEILRAQGRALSSQLETYPWSSYGEYVNSRSDRLCDPKIILDYFSKSPLQGKTTYRSFVTDYLGIANTERLREISSGSF
ncbi:MAG: transposase [Patescibacteria group bacterium]